MYGMSNFLFRKSRAFRARKTDGLRRLLRVLPDLAVSGLSFLLAMQLRLGWSAFGDWQYLLSDFALFSAVCGAVYALTGLSFRSWRFVSMQDVFALARDVIIAVSAFMILGFLFARLTSVPRSVPIIASFIMISALGGMRVFYRYLVEGRFALKDFLRDPPIHLLAYGATSGTDAFLRSLQLENARSHRVVGIVDDDPATWDRRIRGVEVLGGTADLPQIASDLSEESLKIKGIVVPSDGLPREKLCEIVNAAARSNLKVLRLPRACDLLKKSNEYNFEPIEVGDLLPRQPVTLKLESIDAMIRGKSVVVTGGGGSIGSELCQHLLARGPAKLVVIDHCEFNLFQITRRLRKDDRVGVVKPILASVRDRERIRRIFEEERVDLVFHAAAYKHVPLVESNPIEGVLTNFIGTCNVADAAAAVGAAAMVLVSTDKAVKPSSVMGLTKRVAEAYCQAIDLDCARHEHSTRFVVVRFGNVLGSSGSVVPIFDQQIRNGGPVTVTDPNMTRFFMTIPEAVELVLQASAFALGRSSWHGAIFVLDMGAPVKIVELARRMISLAGFVPERDISIEFTGIREGEKLHEELFDEDDVLEVADTPGFRIARSQVQALHRMREIRDRIIKLASSSEEESMIQLLRDALSKKVVRTVAAVSHVDACGQKIRAEREPGLVAVPHAASPSIPISSAANH